MLTALACTLLAATASPAPAWTAVKVRLQGAVTTLWRARHREKRNAIEGDHNRTPSDRFTVPLPAAWPPNGGGAVVVYAFATGLRPGLSHGEQVAAPWARVLVEGESWKVEDLGPLRALGIQGMRPLRAEELKVARTAEEAEQALVSLTRSKKPVGPPPPILQRYYCQWQSNNGVIAAEVKQRHESFFAWLACAK